MSAAAAADAKWAPGAGAVAAVAGAPRPSPMGTFCGVPFPPGGVEMALEVGTKYVHYFPTFASLSTYFAPVAVALYFPTLARGISTDDGSAGTGPAAAAAAGLERHESTTSQAGAAAGAAAAAAAAGSLAPVLLTRQSSSTASGSSTSRPRAVREREPTAGEKLFAAAASSSAKRLAPHRLAEFFSLEAKLDTSHEAIRAAHAAQDADEPDGGLNAIKPLASTNVEDATDDHPTLVAATHMACNVCKQLCPVARIRYCHDCPAGARYLCVPDPTILAAIAGRGAAASSPGCLALAHTAQRATPAHRACPLLQPRTPYHYTLRDLLTRKRIALNNLGACYQFGHGVVQDEKKAAELYAQAVALGEQSEAAQVAAATAAAAAARKGSGPAPAPVAAAHYPLDSSVARNNLAVCHLRGCGVPMNKPRAVQLLRAARDGGCWLSAVTWASLLAFGEAIHADGRKDNSGAVDIWMSLAHAGWAPGQGKLALCYLDGTGVERSHARCVAWLQRAEPQGYARAQCTLGVCYENGYGVEANEAKAMALYRVSADSNFGDSLYNMALSYDYGNSVVTRDPSVALFYHSRAAHAGDPEAMFRLAVLYASADAEFADPHKSREWFWAAAKAKQQTAEILSGSTVELKLSWAAVDYTVLVPVLTHVHTLILSGNVTRYVAPPSRPDARGVVAVPPIRRLLERLATTQHHVRCLRIHDLRVYSSAAAESLRCLTKLLTGNGTGGTGRPPRDLQLLGYGEDGRCSSHSLAALTEGLSAVCATDRAAWTRAHQAAAAAAAAAEEAAAAATTEENGSAVVAARVPVDADALQTLRISKVVMPVHGLAAVLQALVPPEPTARDACPPPPLAIATLDLSELLDTHLTYGGPNATVRPDYDMFEKGKFLETSARADLGLARCVLSRDISILARTGLVADSLRVLNLSFNGFSSPAAGALGQLLRHSGTLETLRLEGCLMKTTGSDALLHALTHADSRVGLTLNELVLSGNDVSLAGTTRLFGWVAGGGRYAHVPPPLNAVAGQTEPDHLKAFAAGFGPCALTTLRVARCGLTAGALLPLTDMLLATATAENISTVAAAAAPLADLDILTNPLLFHHDNPLPVLTFVSACARAPHLRRLCADALLPPLWTPPVLPPWKPTAAAASAAAAAAGTATAASVSAAASAGSAAAASGAAAGVGAAADSKGDGAGGGGVLGALYKLAKAALATPTDEAAVVAAGASDAPPAFLDPPSELSDVSPPSDLELSVGLAGRGSVALVPDSVRTDTDVLRHSLATRRTRLARVTALRATTVGAVEDAAAADRIVRAAARTSAGGAAAAPAAAAAAPVAVDPNTLEPHGVRGLRAWLHLLGTSRSLQELVLATGCGRRIPSDAELAAMPAGARAHWSARTNAGGGALSGPVTASVRAHMRVDDCDCQCLERVVGPWLAGQLYPQQPQPQLLQQQQQRRPNVIALTLPDCLCVLSNNKNNSNAVERKPVAAARVAAGGAVTTATAASSSPATTFSPALLAQLRTNRALCELRTDWRHAHTPIPCYTWLHRNQQRRTAHDRNWARVAVVIACVRANSGNPLRYSILALLPHICHWLPRTYPVQPQALVRLEKRAERRLARYGVAAAAELDAANAAAAAADDGLSDDDGGDAGAGSDSDANA